ncbi:TPA: hypothetical protein ACOEEB_004666 [Enterobacter asburiae]
MIAFTKEQLIASAHARIEFAEMMLAGELEPLKERTWSIELELARIALASLEAERNAENVSDAELNAALQVHKLKVDGHSQLSDAFRAGFIYARRTASPASVSIPDEWRQWIADAVEYLEGGLEADGELEAEGSIEAKRLLSRRAAMLQGAEPVSNRDELPYDPQIATYEKIMEQAIPDGWVMVPISMTPEQMRAVQIKSELGSYAAANLSGAYDLFREFWDVAVTAVQQQE